MTTTNSGSFSTYNLRGMIPHQGWGWDDYANRLSRYDVNQQYYNNVQYHRIVSYSEALKASERLYKHARGVYNPVFRLVELYVAKIAGGALDYKDASNSPAFPIDTDNEALMLPIAKLWRDSRWQQKKSLYIRNGVMMGDSFLKVVDDVKRGVVRMEVLDPTCVRHLEKDDAGVITRVVIEYYVANAERLGALDMYTEVITPEKYQTFRNGNLYDYYQNAMGEPIAEWDNDYGFVPVYHALNRDVGMLWGANVFYNSMQKINEINDIASILNDGARNQVRFPVVFSGAKANDVVLGGSSNDTPNKDALNAIYLPKEATVTPLVPNISLADGLLVIQEVLAELERDFPELALHRLREGGNLTAPGVKSAYSDAIARIQEAMSNYDATLVEAQRGALSIGAMRGYEGYQGLGMGIDDVRFDHNIKLRPVIDDTLGKAERIALILQSADSTASSVLLPELGLSEEEVAQITEASNGRMGITYAGQLSMQNEPLPDDVNGDGAKQAVEGSKVNAGDLASVLAMMN